MSVYSFLDVDATIAGVGGSFNLANGAAAAEEGITVERFEDKNIMVTGADGSGMHSLIASDAGTITVRLLKTSPVNAQLQTMFNLQTRSSATHGKNVITIRDSARGDFLMAAGVAFVGVPAINYAKEGGIMEWTFHAIQITYILGVGTPEL